jgi:hypothetical protein
MDWNSHKDRDSRKGGNVQRRAASAAALGLAGLFTLHGAFAAPPLRQQMHTPIQSPAVAAHLDLRVPPHILEAASNSERNLGAFPSRRQSVGPQETVQLPALGSDAVRARPTLQEFVRRVHQEGLPVARIFEGKSALVHLGLSPKGKPGLWLVQKTR